MHVDPMVNFHGIYLHVFGALQQGACHLAMSPLITNVLVLIPRLSITSSLSSQTWRINKFFHSKSSFGRLKITEFDVLMPFLVLLTLNFIVLICWTVIDPLRYQREFLLGTDYWNREIASVGRCESENAVAYLVPLALGKYTYGDGEDLLESAIGCWQLKKRFCFFASVFSEFRLPRYCSLAGVASKRHRI